MVGRDIAIDGFSSSSLLIRGKRRPVTFTVSVDFLSFSARKSRFRGDQPRLRAIELMLQCFDIINGHLDSAGLADCLISSLLLLLFAGFHIASCSFFGGSDLRKLHGNQSLNLSESIVDSVSTALFGQLVIRTLGAQVFCQGFGV